MLAQFYNLESNSMFLLFTTPLQQTLTHCYSTIALNFLPSKLSFACSPFSYFKISIVSQSHQILPPLQITKKKKKKIMPTCHFPFIVALFHSLQCHKVQTFSTRMSDSLNLSPPVPYFGP